MTQGNPPPPLPHSRDPVLGTAAQEKAIQDVPRPQLGKGKCRGGKHPSFQTTHTQLIVVQLKLYSFYASHSITQETFRSKAIFYFGNLDHSPAQLLWVTWYHPKGTRRNQCSHQAGPHKQGGCLAESELQIHVLFKIPLIFQKAPDSINSNLVERGRRRFGCESKINELCFALSFWFFLIAVCTLSAICPLKESV